MAERHRCGSAAEVDHGVGEVWKDLRFPLDGGPLCSVHVYEVVDGAGAPVSRWLAWFFDHLIADYVSAQLFKQACGTWPRSLGRFDSYAEWLRRQRRSFHSLDTPAADFWRQHLRDAPLAVCDRLPARIAGQDGGSRELVLTARTLPAAPATPSAPSAPPSAEDALAALCEQHTVTPFMVLTCAVALATAEGAVTDDMVLVLSTHGRDQASMNVFGYLSNLVPLRLDLRDTPQLADALERVGAAIVDTAAHCATPWPYINRVAGTGQPDTFGEATVTINHVPHLTFTDGEVAALSGSTTAGQESGLWIDVLQRVGGGISFSVKYDPTRYAADRVEEFCDSVLEQWEQLLLEAV